MFKKFLSSFFFCAAATAVLIPGMALNADSQVEINKTNFPDDNFRTLVSDDFDNDKDGKLSQEELEEVNEIYYSEDEISSLKGIEFFTELKKLTCTSNKLEELDLSGNPELTELDCGSNKLTSLNLTNNSKLEDLDCSENEQLCKLDISINTKLKKLDCNKCGLKELDLSNNGQIEDVDCSYNDIVELDLTNNKKIRFLSASHNKLTSIDLSDLTKLSNINLENNKLKSLDIVDWEEIYQLSLYGNKIDYLDISKCKRLVKGFTEGDERVCKGYSIYNFQQHIDNAADLRVDHKTMIMTESVELSEEKTESLRLPCGSCAKVYVKGADGSADISWSSSDNSLVTVDNKGVVKAVMGGSATVTASLDGKEYKCSIRSLYKDVRDPSKFWYEPTYALTDAGVVKGYDAQTRFKPANMCTRAQMVTFIWRLVGSPEPENKDCMFSDVEETDYYYKACLWGNEKGIVEGYKDGTFGPQINCARKHAVTFLWRLAGKPDPKSDKNKFKDVKKSDYFYKATLWAAEQKIVAGYNDNTFRPDGDCLRRQMVTFLYKYEKNVGVK